MTVRRTNPAVAAVIFLLLTIWLVPSQVIRGADAQRQAIFTPQARYSVEITSIDGNDYVNLFEVLEPLKKVDAAADGKNWKVIVAGTPPLELRFRDKKRKFNLAGGTLELPSDFRLIGGKGFVPVASLDWLLTRVTGLPSEMHASTHRLFLGGVTTRINAELRKSPSRLVLTFPFAVNPEITNEGNTIRLVFNREPVVSTGTESLSLGDPVFASAGSVETARGTEFVVRGNAPLTLALADSGRSVIISGPQVAAAPAQPAAQLPSNATSTPSTHASAPNPNATTNERRTFVVVVDPAHGGGDTGAIFSDRLLEKDVTLGIARRLVNELQSRGVPAMLVRSGDTQIGAEQRALIANTAAPSRTYVSIHVAASGTGVRIYRAMPVSTGSAQRTSFVPWQSAQTGWLDRSAELAGAIAAECARRQLGSRSTALPMPTLNFISGPAVAVEVAAPTGKVADVATVEFQQNIASALANAIAASQSPAPVKQGGTQ